MNIIIELICAYEQNIKADYISMIMNSGENISVLITGGTRGIGKAIGLKMAEKGYDIIAVYRNNDLEASDFSSKVKEKGRNCKLYKADLSNEDERTKFIEDVKRNNYRLRALINNAGLYRSETLDSLDLKDWDRVIRVNETVPVLMSRDLHDNIENGGSIINIGSMRGIISSVEGLSYQASKASLIHITKFLAKSLAPKIRVNCIISGFIRTDMTYLLHTDENIAGAIESLTPMGRWGEPQDIAEAVDFLISDKASFITGQGLIVDGGIGLLKNI